MSETDNPPAFPEVPSDSNAYEGRPGASLRDYFAAQAPVTLAHATASCSGRLFIDVPEDREFLFKVLSTLRYEYADAMLAERQKELSK